MVMIGFAERDARVVALSQWLPLLYCNLSYREAAAARVGGVDRSSLGGNAT